MEGSKGTHQVSHRANCSPRILTLFASVSALLAFNHLSSAGHSVCLLVDRSPSVISCAGRVKPGRDTPMPDDPIPPTQSASSHPAEPVSAAPTPPEPPPNASASAP